MQIQTRPSARRPIFYFPLTNGSLTSWPWLSRTAQLMGQVRSFPHLLVDLDRAYAGKSLINFPPLLLNDPSKTLRGRCCGPSQGSFQRFSVYIYKPHFYNATHAVANSGQECGWGRRVCWLGNPCSNHIQASAHLTDLRWSCLPISDYGKNKALPISDKDFKQ